MDAAATMSDPDETEPFLAGGYDPKVL